MLSNTEYISPVLFGQYLQDQGYDKIQSDLFITPRIWAKFPRSLRRRILKHLYQDAIIKNYLLVIINKVQISDPSLADDLRRLFYNKRDDVYFIMDKTQYQELIEDYLQHREEYLDVSY